MKAIVACFFFYCIFVSVVKSQSSIDLDSECWPTVQGITNATDRCQAYKACCRKLSTNCGLYCYPNEESANTTRACQCSARAYNVPQCARPKRFDKECLAETESISVRTERCSAFNECCSNRTASCSAPYNTCYPYELFEDVYSEYPLADSGITAKCECWVTDDCPTN